MTALLSLGRKIFAIALSCFLVSHSEASAQLCASVFSSQTIEESYFSHPDFHGLFASSELQLSSRPAGGSQGGRWFTDNSGKFYFAKSYQGKIERVLAENLTNKIYNLMGAPAPKSFLKMIDGVPHLISPEIKGVIARSAAELKDTDIAESFILDTWLANWDVLGMNFDNVLIAENHAVRIDNGGSMFWRAMGGAKDFTPAVTEVSTMRNPLYNSGKVFGELSSAELAGQIQGFALNYASKRLTLTHLIKDSGFPTEMQDKILNALDQRAKWLLLEALPKIQDSFLQNEKSLTTQLTSRIGHSHLKADMDQISSILQKNPDSVLTSLSMGERLALIRYIGNDFKILNGILHETSPLDLRWLNKTESHFLIRSIQPHVNLLNSALAKLPSYVGSVSRTATIPEESLSRYKVGQIIIEPSFVSTTNHDGGYFAHGNVVFSIKSKTGKNINAAWKTGEDEILFRSGTQFMVQKSEQLPDGTWSIQLEEVTSYEN